MTAARRYDAVVIGSGPNGLAAAIVLAQAGRAVLVREGAPTIGGGTRSEALTLPGFVHDVCSAVHPLAAASPFFRTLPLAAYGLEWIHPPAPLAHPLDEGTAVVLERSVEATAATLGGDGEAYRRLMTPLVETWPWLVDDVLALPRLPAHPAALARFAWRARRSARRLAERTFAGERARALFAGLAAHAVQPLEHLPTSGIGLLLAAAGHGAGWPVARGGSERIADALAAHLASLGGEVAAGEPVRSLDEVAGARAVLCDVTPRQLLQLAGARLPPAYRRTLERFRYGPASFKIDWALDGPIPWTAPDCARAGTVHVGGTLAEIARSERQAWAGVPAERPYVLVAQQSLFDPARAPAGRHTVWAYCHVPHGADADMTAPIERQIERFAPGFRDRVIARHVMPPAALERRNPNLVGGDIQGGVQDVAQMLARPTWRHYRTPVPGLYLCSSSTPPGGGVHGMCGYWAARAALDDGF